MIDNLTVVVPMLHEEENVGPFMERLIPSLDKSAKQWRIIVTVMDDDPTKDLLKNYPVEILDRPKELGLAFRKGLERALQYNGLIMTMVADLSDAPEEMNRLLNAPGDIVIGARGPEIHRRFLSRMVNSFLLGPCTDYTTAYRLYTKSVLETVLPKVRSKGYAFLPEIILHALREGFEITEVGVSHPSRVNGFSKLNYKSNIIEYTRLIVWRYT